MNGPEFLSFAAIQLFLLRWLSLETLSSYFLNRLLELFDVVEHPIFQLGALEDIAHRRFQVQEQQHLISHFKVLDERIDDLSGGEICSVDVRAIDHHRGLVLEAVFVDEVAHEIRRREDETTVRGKHEILDTARGDQLIQVELWSSGVIQDEDHVQTDTDQDTVLDRQSQTSNECCDSGYQIGLFASPHGFDHSDFHHEDYGCDDDRRQGSLRDVEEVRGEEEQCQDDDDSRVEASEGSSNSTGIVDRSA